MQSTMAAQHRLDLLDTRVKLNISINDLRILVNCLRALEYLEKADNEAYMDADALSLKQRLERTYKSFLARLGV